MSHPLHTKAWATLRQAQGHTPVWIGHCLMLIKPIKWPFKSFGVMSQVDLDDLSIDELVKQAKTLGLSHVQIDPANATTDRESAALLNKINPKRKTESLVPRKTSVLDITQSDQDLLTGMKKNWRYNIKLAHDKGVRVEEQSNDTGLAQFLDLYFETVAKKNFLGRNRTYFAQVWEKMSAAGLAHIFVAYIHDTPIVARMIFTDRETIYTVYTGTSRSHSDIKAAYLTVWELIQWGKQHNFKAINMWGADPDAIPKSKDFGYSQFKLGFGGEIVEYLPAYDLVISPLYYRIFKLGNAFRLFVLRAKAKLK